MYDILQANTFQGILVTDGEQSYALFTYNCDMMEWSGNATVGFNAAGKFFHSHFLSGTHSITNIACINSPQSSWSNIIYQLSKFRPYFY